MQDRHLKGKNNFGSDDSSDVKSDFSDEMDASLILNHPIEKDSIDEIHDKTNFKDLD